LGGHVWLTVLVVLALVLLVVWLVRRRH